MLISKFGTSQPLILLLDGLDQISETNFGRELDRWIPPNFPCGVKVVISMITDRSARVFPVARKLIYGQPGFEKLFVNIGRLPSADANEILTLWLKRDHRSLTAAQRQEVMKGFAASSSPLYLRLAYQESLKWPSYLPESETRLPSTLRGLIEQMFSRLARVHGKKLLQHACMYIALARDGLSFSELENILSLDDDVLNDVFQYWFVLFYFSEHLFYCCFPYYS